MKRTESDISPAGLYVHIPFCQQKCEYCDFYSITQLDLQEEFVEALVSEMELRAPQYRQHRFTTLFFGGGTPSILSESQFGRIWRSLRECFHIDPAAEITIETNPGTLDAGKLAFYKELGINRLSMGVQSFNPQELQFLGRIHRVEEVLENVAAARAAGFDNLNLDLMTAFPGITLDSFAASLEEALKLRPEHLSCYTLIFEPGTVFYKRMLRGELNPLSEEEEAQYYQYAAERLGREGYQQYEISNFSLGETRCCRHNLLYWRHHPYLGLGPSAHSFSPPHRFGNVRSLAAYIKSLRSRELPVDFQEELSRESLMTEYVFLGLRLKEGISLPDFEERFGRPFTDQFQATLERLRDQQMLEVDRGRVRLSARGWLIADEISAYF